MKLSRFDEAASVFSRSLALHPDNVRERHLLASIQLTAHKPQDALATLGPLLGAAEPDAETLELASSAYEDTSDTPKAVSTLRQAILLDPHNVNLYLDFANLAFNHQSFQVGIDIITDGLGVLPTLLHSTWRAVCCMCNSRTTTRRRPTSRKPMNWTQARH
jgi:predicted Zn-dependent protease